jgi:SpoVK/Ycf46/Vps4 family AAA+-type ATPase
MIRNGGIVLMAGVPGMLSEALSAVRSIEKDRRILVIFEDIDEIIEEYNEADVLAILDGERQIDNVVFIATTNYPENLDGRIKNRPSRFDRVEKIDVPSNDARRVYLEAKLSEHLKDEEISKWVEITKGFSIAHIKELIVNVLCLGNALEEQVKRIKNMKKEIKSDSGAGPLGFGGLNE